VEPTLNDRRTVLGLLGGICAGKSFVARRIATLAPTVVVEADALAAEALDAAARDGSLERTLGGEVLREDGTPDRGAIARRVFSRPEELAALEGLIHPAVRARIDEQLRRHADGVGAPLLVLDVPLLLERGLDRRCDALWFVEVPEDVRQERAAQRGVTPEDLARRDASQLPLDRKRAKADLVIRGDEELDPQIQAGLRALGVATPPRT
jgi:dephospho-CoA kinase